MFRSTKPAILTLSLVALLASLILVYRFFHFTFSISNDLKELATSVVSLVLVLVYYAWLTSFLTLRKGSEIFASGSARINADGSLRPLFSFALLLLMIPMVVLFRADGGVGIGDYKASIPFFALMTLILFSISEEILFRGIFLHISRSWTESVFIVLMIQGAVFALFHFGSINGSSTAVVALLFYFLFSVAISWLRIVSNSLIWCATFHAAWNVISFNNNLVILNNGLDNYSGYQSSVMLFSVLLIVGGAVVLKRLSATKSHVSTA